MLTPYIIARSLFDDVEEPIISGRYVSDATAGGMRSSLPAQLPCR